jgi:polysaccharide export outer membrane protein
MRQSRIEAHGAAVALVAVFAIVAAGPIAGQTPNVRDPDRLNPTRADLEILLQRYEAAAESPAYSEVLRQRARLEASKIGARLQQGDFRVGDRVAIEVQGNADFSGTFTVEEGRKLTLSMIGEVPLTGVLRTELAGHVADYLGRFLRDPQVQARALISLAVVGGVLQPGFYTFPADALLSDVIMGAGGPASDANMNNISVERGRQVTWEPAQLRQALAEGTTVEQLSLQAGDRVVVAQGGSGTLGSLQQVLGFTALVLSLPFMVVGATRIF